MDNTASDLYPAMTIGEVLSYEDLVLEEEARYLDELDWGPLDDITEEDV